MSTGNTGTVSTHFNFTLPGYDDDTDIDDLNTNFNIIDTSLYDAVQDIATNASDISSLQDSVAQKMNIAIRYWGPDVAFNMRGGSHALVCDSKSSVAAIWRSGGGLEAITLVGTINYNYALNGDTVTIRDKTNQNRTYTVFYVIR